MRNLLVMLLLICGAAQAQTFKGKVTDTNRNPIAYASIFIREKGSGYTADANGEFSFQLAPGSYKLEVSSLGYTQKNINLNQTQEDCQMEIALEEMVYQLQNVTVSGKNQEDPAYAVMRRAIAHAPYYRSIVESYKAERYVKGGGKISDAPAILNLSKEFREEFKKIKNQRFIYESQEELTFTSPRKLDVYVKAHRNSFPEAIDVDMDMPQLYDEEISGAPSPLSTKAFSYYRFRHEGYFAQDGQLVNKIKVMPKSSNRMLLSGYIYIIENLWCISNADLNMHKSGINFYVKVTCKNFQDKIYLPVSYSGDLKFKMMGFDADASIIASVSYQDVKIKDKALTFASLNKAVSSEEKPTPKPQSSSKESARTAARREKINSRIEKILAKEDLSTSDAYKLAKLSNSLNQLSDSAYINRESKYEEVDVEITEKSRTDSLAGTHDSLYWANVRTVPLSEEELASFVRKDSLDAVAENDSIKNKEKEKKKNSTLWGKFTDNIGGYSHKFKNTNTVISFAECYGMIGQLNHVDGQQVGMKFTTTTRWGKRKLTFTPTAYYAISRNAFIGYGDLHYTYNPKRYAYFDISGGIKTVDFNPNTNIDQLRVNSLATGALGLNRMKFYEKRFIQTSHDTDLANGLHLSVGGMFARRRELQCYRKKSWFGKRLDDNIPDCERYQAMPKNQTLQFWGEVRYTPAQYYRMHKNWKEYTRSAFPTFIGRYERAIALHGSLVSPQFDKVSLGIYQKKRVGLMSELEYFVNTGAFFNKKDMQFPDFKHFSASKLIFVPTRFASTFTVLDNYEYSTNDRWLNANVNYLSPELLFKYLPLLRDMLFDEALHVRCLAIPHADLHTELGYSIGLSGDVRIGAFAGFRKDSFKQLRVSVSINLNEFK